MTNAAVFPVEQPELLFVVDQVRRHQVVMASHRPKRSDTPRELRQVVQYRHHVDRKWSLELRRRARVRAHGLERAEVKHLADDDIPSSVQVAKQGRQARHHGWLTYCGCVERSTFDESRDEKASFVMDDLRRQVSLA